MRTRILNLWDTLRTSYWFVPAFIVMGAGLLSVMVPLADQWLFESNWTLPGWIRTTTDTARTTLAAMAGAMVAVTGTVFSITIVTLSLTSQQFGPRLLRRFMYDLPTQVTLGLFLSSGFYCLFVLRMIENNDDKVITVPHLSVLLGVVLTGVSLAALIFFIHHVAMLIQAPHVVAAVARDLDDAIVRLFPERIGDPPSDRSEDTTRQLSEAAKQAESLSDQPLVIRSTNDGYIQAIAADTLLNIATERELIMSPQARPGNFISIDSPLFHVWLGQDNHSDGSVADDSSSRSQDQQSNPVFSDLEELARQLNETVIVGSRRTPRQDVECAVDELVEVAVRSLSPGINDPFTAISCIDWLGAALGRLAERRLPAAFRCDEDGQLRVIAHPVTFPEVLNSAFNQIRQYSRDSVAVTIRLLETLESISTHVHRPEDGDAIRQHAAMIVRHAETLTEDGDRHDIRERFENLIATKDDQ